MFNVCCKILTGRVNARLVVPVWWLKCLSNANNAVDSVKYQIIMVDTYTVAFVVFFLLFTFKCYSQICYYMCRRFEGHHIHLSARGAWIRMVFEC